MLFKATNLPPAKKTDTGSGILPETEKIDHTPEGRGNGSGERGGSSVKQVLGREALGPCS